MPKNTVQAEMFAELVTPTQWLESWKRLLPKYTNQREWTRLLMVLVKAPIEVVGPHTTDEQRAYNREVWEYTKTNPKGRAGVRRSAIIDGVRQIYTTSPQQAELLADFLRQHPEENWFKPYYKSFRMYQGELLERQENS